MTTFQAMRSRLPRAWRESACAVVLFLVGEVLVAVDLDRARDAAGAVRHDERGDLAVDLDRAWDAARAVRHDERGDLWSERDADRRQGKQCGDHQVAGLHASA